MTGTSWAQLLTALLAGESLDAGAAGWAMREVMSGDATAAQVAAFAVALRAKGESAQEVGALAAVMLEFAAPVDLGGLRAVDTCGTGGDRAGTVNISTMAALVLAGAGARVVKHGNRSASSRAGSADLLEALGVVIDLPPEGIVASVARSAPAFCFAPTFHPAMRHAAGPRRDIAIPTVFNILGPLTNPARPAAQVVGVADARLAAVLAGVLAGRGSDALVVRGDDGLDELTTATTSRVWWVSDGRVREEVVDPALFGLRPGVLTGGDAAHNAAVCRALLGAAPGPTAGGTAGGAGGSAGASLAPTDLAAVRDAVLLNAAAGLVAWEPGEGALSDQLAAGLVRAAASLDSGAAAAALQRWVAVSSEVAAGLAAAGAGRA